MKREEILIQTAEVKVRVMELAPGDATTWHVNGSGGQADGPTSPQTPLPA